MQNALHKIEEIGIVPVITADYGEKTVPLAGALLAGGLSCVEVVCRTAADAELIRQISQQLPDLLIGAASVVSIEQVDLARTAGAGFITSSGFPPRVVEYCLEKGIPVVPGCMTPSEMEKAVGMGLEAVRFFPAEQAGGVDFLKAAAVSDGNLRFLAAGGINAANLNRYLSFEKVLACEGCWMIPDDLVAAGDFEAVTLSAREAVLGMLDFELLHIGMNTGNPADAMEAANLLKAMFGFAVKEGPKSIFAGTGFELLKIPFRGTNGHFAVSTTSVSRAKVYLERRGFAILEDTLIWKGGRLTSCYLADEVAGFAIHLRPKS